MKKIISGKYEVQFEKVNDDCKIKFFENGKFCMSLTTKETNLGNYIYVRIKDITKCRELAEHDVDNICLDWSLYFRDFESYSDNFKDINYVRPHLTESEFQVMCNKVIQEVKDVMHE